MEETEGKKRIILFLELVRGCRNKQCPSWGVVCPEVEQEVMTDETLAKVLPEIQRALRSSVFDRVDIWPYGCGDSLDHPRLADMLYEIRHALASLGRISMAIDSRRELKHGEWHTHLDKVKIIHKNQEEFDWFGRAKAWSQILPEIEMSHKFVTNEISKATWNKWLDNQEFLQELKAVSFHNVVIGSDNPILNLRDTIKIASEVPVIVGPYPGMPVCRTMIRWDGSPRRCLIAPTSHKTIYDLITGEDDICKTCFPLTGTGLARFQSDQIYITPSATCVSDGYYRPIF